MRILLVPQTILRNRFYSANDCVCSCYINIKSLTLYHYYNSAAVEVFC